MKIKGLLIDFDGVLIDSTRAYMKATNNALKRFNYFNVPKDEVREISLEIARRLDLGVSRDKLLDGIISISGKDNSSFMDVWLQTWNEACLWEVELIPDVNKLLNDLSKSFPLALVTLRYIKRPDIEDQLRRLKINRYFQTIITALDVKRPKPNPDSFLEGAKRLNVSINDCAVVGDSILDIKAGKASGAKTVAVLSGIFDESALKKENPDLIIKNILELSIYLE
ncbi:MAG: HAD family phosphatase [Candidatus Heimdallarchaeota archaeon]|nr:MAG: HAD family phosphatase [Candidatus Heimdallarchaeota archaeon]